MCGRFSASVSPTQLTRLFRVDELTETVPPRWNVAPTDPVVAIALSRREGRRRAGVLRWGLVPGWVADPKVGSRLINARAETVTEKPAYREAFASRRVLIPADGWYEWRRRQPYFLYGADGQPLAFGGVWESWMDPVTGERLRTCAILTTAANGATRGLHDRMPLVLPPDTWDTWLAREPLSAHERADLLRPAADTAVVFHPVSRRVNDVRNDGADLTLPVEPAPA